jgi:hypothetical protein
LLVRTSSPECQPTSEQVTTGELFMLLYANIVVQLTGADPNLLTRLGRCRKLAREGGLERDQIEALSEEFV